MKMGREVGVTPWQVGSIVEDMAQASTSIQNPDDAVTTTDLR